MSCGAGSDVFFDLEIETNDSLVLEGIQLIWIEKAEWKLTATSVATSSAGGKQKKLSNRRTLVRQERVFLDPPGMESIDYGNGLKQVWSKTYLWRNPDVSQFASALRTSGGGAQKVLWFSCQCDSGRLTTSSFQIQDSMETFSGKLTSWNHSLTITPLLLALKESGRDPAQFVPGCLRTCDYDQIDILVVPPHSI
jgi:hypothetical protein